MTTDAGLLQVVGDSDAFLAFQEELSRAARVDRPVLLVGERGTGKELAAARLHYHSERWREPMVALNCAALSPALLESELFGHEQGAFTGAAARRQGRFEAADGGSLFLDEIARMPLRLQEKILRAVEYGSFERVGSSQPVSVDVRIIGATNEDLPDLCRRGKFKRDLLDRLAFLVLTLPPLRERGDDVLRLAEHFAGRMSVELGLDEPPRLTPAARRALKEYPWPGNVRELKNVVERSVFACQGECIEEVRFDPFASPYRPAQEPVARAVGPAAPPAPEQLDLTTPLPEQVERLKLRLLEAALDRSRANQGEAARLLGLSYHQFRGLYRGLKDKLEGENPGA